jgi:hypothetical protein
VTLFYGVLIMTKQSLLLKHLQAGKAFTAKQIAASFGIAHPASAVRNLREQGYCVYSNTAKLSNGAVAVKYRIGKPSKRMLALAYRVAGTGMFSR